MGYELQTAVRFSNTGGKLKARAVDGAGAPLLTMTYGPAATLWRINLGWRRRKDKEVLGFVLDTERGYWARNDQIDPDDPEDPMSQSTKRVVPYVEDRRNCLLIEPEAAWLAEMAPDDREAFMASLQPALKSAIQVLYQLEDSELGAEPLPTRDDRRFILFYEAAEGGAGVLRQLFDTPAAMAQVARTALNLTHFDPESGADYGQSRPIPPQIGAGDNPGGQRHSGVAPRQIYEPGPDLPGHRIGPGPVAISAGQ